MTLSIIIPAYNEENYIAMVLDRVTAVDISLLGFGKEIIVVDDGSSDKTYKIAESYHQVRVISKPNGGKGSAVQRGIQEAKGEWILIQDADLEYFPEDYFIMLKALTRQEPGQKAVYGSRVLGQIKIHGWFPFPGKHPRQGIGPWLMNIILAMETFFLFGRWITDNLTAYKLYPAEILKKHRFITSGFEGDHEITALLLKSKIPIIEVPVRYDPRTIAEGKKIKISDGFIAIWTFIRCRFSNRKEKV